LLSSLKAVGGALLLEAAGIDPEKRPQDIDVAGFCRLANVGQDQASQ